MYSKYETLGPSSSAPVALLPLLVRNERGEVRPVVETRAQLQTGRPSSPQPSSPPAATGAKRGESTGGEGEEPSALNSYGPFRAYLLNDGSVMFAHFFAKNSWTRKKRAAKYT